jgi:hypothetical protein
MPTRARAVVAFLAPLLMASGIVAAPVEAATGASSRYLLRQLVTGYEQPNGYDRDLFRHWVDADGDGCDARDEVLIAEATTKPRILAGCALAGGSWWSRYDGGSTREPSTFDIDHMVPLNEAWQSGAWRWNAQTRKRYANDLGYRASLIAVTASSNRSKSDREPQTWMPERAGYGCRYVKQWVAVKYRWRLTVNAAERSFLRSKLRSCGWPRVAKPTRASIGTASSSTGGGGGGGGDAAPDFVTYDVWPGAFCDEHGWYGYTSARTLMRCKTSATDSRYRWRSAA